MCSFYSLLHWITASRQSVPRSILPHAPFNQALTPRGPSAWYLTHVSTACVTATREASGDHITCKCSGEKPHRLLRKPPGTSVHVTNRHVRPTNATHSPTMRQIITSNLVLLSATLLESDDMLLAKMLSSPSVYPGGMHDGRV